MKEHVKWLKDRCKAINKQISENRPNMWYEDYYGDKLKTQLEECVAIKVATEKFMKKLRHEGN